MTDFRIYGHRGSPLVHRENTIESFEETLRAGADGFETDLRLLSDRTAVLYHDDLWHDAEIESISATQFAEGGGRVVRLGELAQFAGRTRMILEVKRSRWEDLLLSEIGGWSDVVVASFDHRTIDDLHRRAAPFPLGLTIFGRIVGVEDYAQSIGASWVFPAHSYVDAEFVASLHEHAIRVVPWTANTPRDWERLFAAGCDGVITDDPAGAVAWRRERLCGGGNE